MGLVRLKPDGSLGDSLAPPDLPVQREVYVAERRQGKDNVSRSSTNARYAPSYFWVWHPERYFVVAHGGNGEVILARRGVPPLAIVRRMPPVPVDPAERDEEHASILVSMRSTDPAWSWSGPPIPDTKAPIMGLVVTRDGRIWVRVAAPSERIPEEELVKPRDLNYPVQHFRTPAVYEVFATDGRFLGRVRLPRRSSLMEADGALVWLLVRDENDLPAVVRFRIEPAP
jgi:hypothetical protein